MPRILQVDPNNPDPKVVQEIVNVLKGEGLVALPTDTVYGLVADIFSEAALERLMDLKARPHDKPIPIFISSIDDLGKIAREVPEAAERLAQRFWPGPLTLILDASAHIPEAITAGTGTVGVRIPNLPLIDLILKALDRPITGTSANKSGGANPVTPKDVLKGLRKQFDLLVDGGETGSSIPSTVLDCTQFPLRIIRRGAVDRATIAALLGKEAVLGP
jgi:L-threonylcarbamoyladenylate synthase